MQHWNSYWNTTKSLNSFAEGEHSQGYTGDIAEFWRNVFVNTQPNATLLDLATGNGGLAVLAKQSNINFNVFASDAAKIDPLAMFNSNDDIYPLLNKIQFFADMPSESLQFEDNQFDLVISQFGFEYAHPREAIQQIFRVLKPKGRFIALIHHQDSFISEDCRQGIKVLACMMAVGGLFDQLASFGRFCQSIPDKNQLTTAEQTRFKQKNAELLQLFKGLQQDCKNEVELDWFNLLAKDLVPLIMNWRQTNEAKIIQARQSLEHFHLRLQDQLDAAWSPEYAEEMKKLAQKHKANSHCKPFDISQGKLCWLFEVNL